MAKTNGYCHFTPDLPNFVLLGRDEVLQAVPKRIDSASSYRGVVKQSDSWGNLVPRCMKNGARGPRCNVTDCNQLKIGVVQLADSWGNPGPRCMKYGAKFPLRNVTDCNKKKKGIVKKNDKWGSSGNRRGRNGGRNKSFGASSHEHSRSGKCLFAHSKFRSSLCAKFFHFLLSPSPKSRSSS